MTSQTHPTILIMILKANFMTKHEQEHRNELERRYNMSKLELETHRHAPTSLDEVKPPANYYEQRMAEIRAKWQMSELSVVGIPSRKEETVEAYVNSKDAENRQGRKMHLCCGSTEYKGAKVKLWFEVSK
jgi:hypothetical protein